MKLSYYAGISVIGLFTIILVVLQVQAKPNGKGVEKTSAPTHNAETTRKPISIHETTQAPTTVAEATPSPSSVPETTPEPETRPAERLVPETPVSTTAPAVSDDSQRLLVGAFNIKVFGVTKMGREDVVHSLIKIITRYDIILIQEIRDKSQTAIYDLRDRLQAVGHVFSVSLSERLGRTSSKEQYAYFYRSDKVNITQTYQYPVGHDHFERPPYGVLVSSPYTKLSEFGLLGIHTDPDVAETEISYLVQVYDGAAAAFGTKNIMIMGDFNADCSYVTSSEWESVLLWTDPRFEWLLDNDADTTVYTTTDCAYDRFVISGDGWDIGIERNSATVYNFEQALNLTNEDAKLVSDHYPIEFTLAEKNVVSTTVTPITSSTSFTVYKITNWQDLASVTSAADENNVISGYIMNAYTQGGSTKLVKLTSGIISDPICSLNLLGHNNPEMIDMDLIFEAEIHFSGGMLDCGYTVSALYTCVVSYKMVENGVAVEVTISRYL